MREEETKMRTLMQNAKVKLVSQKESLEKINQEKTELTGRVEQLTAELGEGTVRLNAIKSQLESRISRLQTELDESRQGQTDSMRELQEELSRLRKENMELQQRVRDSTTICKLVDLILALHQSDCQIPNWVRAKTVHSSSTNHGQTAALFRSFFR